MHFVLLTRTWLCINETITKIYFKKRKKKETEENADMLQEYFLAKVRARYLILFPPYLKQLNTHFSFTIKVLNIRNITLCGTSQTLHFYSGGLSVPVLLTKTTKLLGFCQVMLCGCGCRTQMQDLQTRKENAALLRWSKNILEAKSKRRKLKTKDEEQRHQETINWDARNQVRGW